MDDESSLHNRVVRENFRLIWACSLITDSPASIERLVVLLAREAEMLQRKVERLTDEIIGLKKE